MGPAPPRDYEPLTEVLVKQWDRLCQDIRATALTVDKLMTIGLALAAAALAFQPQDKSRQHLLYLLLPIPAYGIFIYGSVLWRGVMVYAGHRQYLEEEINRVVGRPLLFVQRLTVEKLHSTLEVYLAFFACVALLLFVSFISANTALQHLQHLSKTRISVIVLNTAAVFICPVIGYKSHGAFRHSYERSSEMAAEARQALVSPENGAE